MQYMKYLKYILKHKWHVLIACIKFGIPLQGILHDISKLRPSEFFPYANYFYGNKDQVKFDTAWLHHQRRNKHHWQYWILTQDEDPDKLIPMPNKYRKEMLADWVGAGKAIKGKEANTRQWYKDNIDKIQLHKETRWWIEQLLCIQ